MHNKYNFRFFICAIFIGLLLGNVIGIALQDYIPILAKGTETKIVIHEFDMIIFALSFTFILKVTLAGVLGILLGLYIYYSR